MEILDADQVEHFLARGFVRIPACFDRQLAEEWRALAFERLGYDSGDPETWAESRVHLPSMNHTEVAEFAPDAWAGPRSPGRSRLLKPGGGTRTGIGSDTSWTVRSRDC